MYKRNRKPFSITELNYTFEFEFVKNNCEKKMKFVVALFVVALFTMAEPLPDNGNQSSEEWKLPSEGKKQLS